MYRGQENKFDLTQKVCFGWMDPNLYSVGLSENFQMLGGLVWRFSHHLVLFSALLSAKLAAVEMLHMCRPFFFFFFLKICFDPLVFGNTASNYLHWDCEAARWGGVNKSCSEKTEILPVTPSVLKTELSSLATSLVWVKRRDYIKTLCKI